LLLAICSRLAGTEHLREGGAQPAQRQRRLFGGGRVWLFGRR
jgi:hypothetical protein